MPLVAYLTAADSDLVRKEKRKLAAAAPAPTPATFQGFENIQLQLPVAQMQPWTAAASARAFATGAVGVAQPALAPALQQATIPRALGQLPDGRRLVSR